LWVLALAAALAPLCAAQQTEKLSLETGEPLFHVLAAIHACGYDHELAASDPQRAAIRDHVLQAAQSSAAALRARDEMCRFYLDHRQPDPARELAQYVSLALNLGPPPEFELTRPAADLPPDAAYVLGIVPLLQRFHQEARLDRVWASYRPRYEAAVEQLHEPVSRLLAEVDFYLRLPISGYLGRSFRIVVDLLGAPGQVNARNYADDYFLVAPMVRGQTRLDPVRHTYLHYILDPMLLKRAGTLRRIEALLPLVQEGRRAAAHRVAHPRHRDSHGGRLRPRGGAAPRRAGGRGHGRRLHPHPLLQRATGRL
jgi:hypothetical protein